MSTFLLRLARLLLALGLGLAAAAPAMASTFRGTVTYVTDGDTLWVRLGPGRKPVQLRLEGVDAPEGCQRFGGEAKQALEKRVLKRQVVVRTLGKDDYQRTLARVQHRGEDLGGWLVREGYAWSSSFRGRPGPYAALQVQARREHRGLWAHPRPQEPRNFRRTHGRCR